jgi:hypothetical protein
LVGFYYFFLSSYILIKSVFSLCSLHFWWKSVRKGYNIWNLYRFMTIFYKVQERERERERESVCVYTFFFFYKVQGSFFKSSHLVKSIVHLSSFLLLYLCMPDRPPTQSQWVTWHILITLWSFFCVPNILWQ